MRVAGRPRITLPDVHLVTLVFQQNRGNITKTLNNEHVLAPLNVALVQLGSIELSEISLPRRCRYSNLDRNVKFGKYSRAENLRM